MSAQKFVDMKGKGEKISVVTCYDYAFARILAETTVDALLVGDSAAMMMHGYKTTLSATVEMMAYHTAAVANGAGKKFIIADMPFMSYRSGQAELAGALDAFMKAGAHAVKVEGVSGHEDAIKFIIESGVPVMGHIGLTPQFIRTFGGYKVQGRTEEGASKIMEQAHTLEKLGCFSIVLECVPSALAEKVTKDVRAATIGIGAGVNCDGQVLVLQDLLGLNLDFSPKFSRKFLEGSALIQNAINSYSEAVKTKTFPNEVESYAT